jgi:hypothetical protein
MYEAVRQFVARGVLAATPTASGVVLGNNQP